MSKAIKVTDKRIFTQEGALREEYRFLEDENRPALAEPEPPAAPREEEPREPEPLGPALELPPAGPGPAPSFFDLLSILTEPVPFYLGDAPLPDGQTGENLEAARFYIDLLDVLRQKTAGNLAAQEAAVLQDLLYRLRMRYVQKRG